MVIGIMGAMPEEVDRLHAEIASPTEEHRGRRTFARGRLFGAECVLVHSRCGKVAAAATATDLIAHHGVGEIIFTGLAGHVAPDLRPGDVVIASSLMQHDLNASPLFPRYEVPLMGVSVFRPDQGRVLLAVEAAEQFVRDDLHRDLDALILEESGIRSPKVVPGLVVSGDTFFSSTEQIRRLRADLPEALCVEMEGAAVAQVCEDYGVPYTIIRTISDGGDDEAHRRFVRSLEVLAGIYSRGILRRLLAPSAA